MADKDDDNLIGYDPLAWMHDQAASAMETTDTSPVNDPAALIPPELEPTAPPAQENYWMTGNATTSNNPDTSRENHLTHLVLESTQGIQNVVELHESLLRALEDANKIEIDASAVQQIDTASLQLLLILKRSAITLQKEISIDFPSDRFIEAATLLGLAEMLGVDQAASGFF